MENKKIMSVDYEYMKECLGVDAEHQKKVAEQYHKFLDRIIEKAKADNSQNEQKAKADAARAELVKALKNYLVICVDSSFEGDLAELIKKDLDEIIDETLRDLDNSFKSFGNMTKAPKGKSDDDIIRNFLNAMFYVDKNSLDEMLSV